MNDLKQKAIALGLCKPFQEAWSDDLVGMYKQGATWCLGKQFPTLGDMLPYDKMLAENDVYNDRLVNLLLTGETYILNQCRGSVEINDYNVAGLYVGLDSIINVNCKDNSILTIECYDNTVLRLKVAKNARCNIWQYGNSCIQILSGNAKIYDKR
jgi:hypothetical protein